MTQSLAVWLLVAVVAALTLSSVLYQRQQQALARAKKAHHLAGIVHALDPVLALLDVLGASRLSKEAIHDHRQGLIQTLALLAPNDGWGHQLAEKAPDTPPRPGGPYSLKSPAQIPQVQGMLLRAANYLAGKIHDPEVIQELHNLHALVASDTLMHAAVISVNKGNFHEARALLERSKKALNHPRIDSSLKLARIKALQDAGMAMARKARTALESELREGIQIEQAFMQMLDLPTQ